MSSETETEIGIDIEQTRSGYVVRSREMRELTVRAENRQRLLRDVPDAAMAVMRSRTGDAVRVEADWRFPTDGSGPKIVLRMRHDGPGQA